MPAGRGVRVVKTERFDILKEMNVVDGWMDGCMTRKEVQRRDSNFNEILKHLRDGTRSE
jgi:hypothetical protein